MSKSTHKKLMGDCFSYVEGMEALGAVYGAMFLSAWVRDPIYLEMKDGLYTPFIANINKFATSEMKVGNVNGFLEDNFPLLEEFYNIVSSIIDRSIVHIFDSKLWRVIFIRDNCDNEYKCEGINSWLDTKIAVHDNGFTLLQWTPKELTEFTAEQAKAFYDSLKPEAAREAEKVVREIGREIKFSRML